MVTFLYNETNKSLTLQHADILLSTSLKLLKAVCIALSENKGSNAGFIGTNMSGLGS